VRFLLFLLFFPALLSAQSRQVKTYFDNQKKQLKEQYEVSSSRNPKLHGAYASYYVSGKVKSRGFFQQNAAEDRWEYFYENGNLKMAGDLRRNKREGIWKFYYENGKPQSEGTYDGGVRQGYWKFYYESGLTKSEGSYLDDQKTGFWQYYYEDGKRRATAEYNGELAFYREFFPAGSPGMEGWLRNEAGDSTWRYFHENGNLKSTGTEKGGQKTGFWKFYGPEGKLISEGEFTGGQPDGQWRYYHKNGKLASEGRERNGLKEGVWKYYSDTGERMAQSQYNSGEGIQEEFYPSGKVKARGPVKNGKYEGKWEYFAEENGSLEGECTFTDGRGLFTGYYPDGKLRLKGTLENDRRVGEWTIYKPDGSVAGYYHTFYDSGPSRPATSDRQQHQPDTVAGVITPTLPYNKPRVRLPRQRSRYFVPRPNEFRGYIIGVNPAAPFLGSLPVSVEYYYRERLGFEAGYILYRSPFAKESARVGLEKLYNRGFGVYLRQKFYQPDDNLGMFYFAHEVRFTDRDYRVQVTERSGGLPYRRTLQADEDLLEYSIMVGDRWMPDPGAQGLTIEGFLGIGFGYRYYRQRWTDSPPYDSLFGDVRKGRISVPLRLGLSIGYVF
jgi:antitoxin component YwqK of YwqJK toxin-antitoxin module